MNYLETIDWILQKIPSYQKIGLNNLSYKPGLERIINLCRYLGNPQKSFDSIHVGGTNGKGSTTNMLYSILIEEGYKVGSFTSPHLMDFRERISCNGNYIDKSFVVDFIKQNKSFLEKESISFFEMNTAMAFQYFREKKIDIAVIEVGMGGRLDSTNIINPIISIITNISIDHSESLGDNELKIAFEKAGIIKKTVPVVIGEDISDIVKKFFFKFSLKNNSPIYFFLKKNFKSIKINNNFFDKIIYQNINKNLVLYTIDILNKKNFLISNNSINKGLINIKKNTNFKGRWSIIKKKYPKIICDIAHNKNGIKMVNLQLKKESYENLHLVLGFVKDKKVSSFIKFFPHDSYYYFCQPSIERKYDINKLKILIKKIFIKNEKFNFFYSVKSAFFSAKKLSKKNDLILICGSTFIVYEIFKLL
ncbi:bifunctional folylpolyglutamate synthase/dihydrofolate synthase [Blattabacterium cuenoti]|uniref:bifunctional folylpolyglutamate synthase/dihydrofolate synthase n=1 Tax=Blattabacterium cuenoti TaxID=1653831 RepID=UPI00163C228F|nr:Mur ligase family protein [Blattabacterium cuenoti]